MKTLSTKVLPQVRVLLQKCRESKEQEAHLKNDCQHLSVFKTITVNPKFDFYKVSDGELIVFHMAVLKENQDSIIPYSYYHDVEDSWFTYCKFLDNGDVEFKRGHSYYQEEFCRSIETFFQYANIYHNIVPK